MFIKIKLKVYFKILILSNSFSYMYLQYKEIMSAINIPVNTALTSDLLYGLKPAAPKSRSYRLNIAPLNKSVFQPLDQMIFEIPTGRQGTYLDNSETFLKFSVQCSSTAAVSQGNTGIYVDNSAYSFIQRVDTYCIIHQTYSKVSTNMDNIETLLLIYLLPNLIKKDYPL